MEQLFVDKVLDLDRLNLVGRTDIGIKSDFDGYRFLLDFPEQKMQLLPDGIVQLFGIFIPLQREV